MSPIDLPAKTSGWAAASSTVSGSSGHPGVTAEKPASSKYFAQGSQLLGSSQRPWTKATGVFPDSLARSISFCSSSLIVTVVAAAAFFLAIKGPPHVGRAVILLDSRSVRVGPGRQGRPATGSFVHGYIASSRARGRRRRVVLGQVETPRTG